MNTREVLDHQFEGFSAGSADEIIKDFADDAVMLGPDGVFMGRDAIHAVYRDMFSDFFKPGAYELFVDAENVVGEIAYIAWRATSAKADIVLGTDTFIFRNGKIVVQTYASKTEPK